MFFFWGGAGVIQKNYSLKGGHVKKIGKLRGGHAIFKSCFPNPTSPPSLVKKMNGPLNSEKWNLYRISISVMTR